MRFPDNSDHGHQLLAVGYQASGDRNELTAESEHSDTHLEVVFHGLHVVQP